MAAVAYYNEFDGYAAAWLRNLISAGHLPAGDVDERSIVDVAPSDLAGYTQCHFFAGIGGWSLAARLAGWPDDRELWTGSCPCQPFSNIGQKRGVEDERHLWPVFAGLIAARMPAVVMGEQVASAAGRDWYAGVRADLEKLGYDNGGADLCAAGVEAPHIRQRIYWVADTNVADENERTSGRKQSVRDGDREYLEGLGYVAGEPLGSRGLAWKHSEAIECADGWRRIESGAQPMASGISSRMDKIRAYGNAICVPLAAEVIGAYMDCRP